MEIHGNSAPEEAPPRLSRDWPAFADKLAAALGELKEDQFLIFSVKRSNRFIQFAAQGSFGLRAETTGNAFLAKSEQLDEQQIARLLEAGWLPPTVNPSEYDPDGSPNFHIDFPAPPAPTEIATLAVTTLAEILRVPHPGFLEYEAFDGEDNSLVIPGLGLKRAARGVPPDQAELAKRLLATMREVTGIAELDYDKDGDIAVSYGRVAVFIFPLGTPPHVRIYAPLLLNVEQSPRLHARLNEFNAGLGHMHFFHRDDAIYAMAEIPAVPLVAEHLGMALRHFCETADGIDELLAAEFGGKMQYSGDMPSLLRH